MTLDELIDIEVEELDNKATQFMYVVQEALSEIRNGEKVTMRLKVQDRYRLLTLKVWAERYRVPVSYILQLLVPIWEGFVKRHSKRMRREGLGVRVATLCGKKSKEILEEQIKKDFPAGENKLEYIQREQLRILEWEVRRRAKQDDDGIKTPDQLKKSLLDFSYPRYYVRYYRHRVRREGRERERIIKEIEEKPYRGNPFLEETV